MTLNIAIPTSNNYSLIPDVFSKPSSRTKHVSQEVQHKTIFLHNQEFEVADIRVVLVDIQDVIFNKFLSPVIQYIGEYAPTELIQQSFPFLCALNEETIKYEHLNLPLFSAYFPSDEELLVEWNFEHFKIGLSFEKDEEESGWYIVHDATMKHMKTLRGYLKNETDTQLADKIISQVVENAI